MRRSALALLLCCCGGYSIATASVSEAVAAQWLLAEIADARVISIERQPGTEGASTVHGVAFAFEGLRWLYVAESGTRVLGAAEADWPTADRFAERLRIIDPRVVRVTYHPRPAAPKFSGEQFQLRNGCVLGSLASLSNLLGRNGRINAAGLVLLSYARADAATADMLRVDHCVLVYREQGRWRCIDPLTPDEPLLLDHIDVGAPLDPALVRLALRARYPLETARLLPLSAATLRRMSESALWQALAGTLRP